MKMKNKKLLIISLITILIDILSKLLVVNNLIENQSISIIKKILNITYAKNTGVAFSFLDGNKIFIIIATIIILIILIKHIKNTYIDKIEQIGYGLIIGGAIGNLIDRIIYGHVIDFIDFRIINYPIFNLADTAIVIGVFIILFKSFHRK